MFGALCLENADRRVHLERERLLEMPVLRARLSPEGWGGARRLDRAARMLCREGVRRVLPLRGFDGWEALERRGLRRVEPVFLYRRIAPSLALAALERQGLAPRRASVALRGERVDGDLARAARALCPTVRDLIIDAPGGGGALAKQLYWEFGAAVCPDTGAGADVSLRFGGSGGGPDELRLCGTQAQLCGLSLEAPGVPLPRELEPDPVLAALWECGRLDAGGLRIRWE